jgi:hypothetical protein
MLGMQNTPDKKSWRADQPSGEEYIIDMFYHDATGVITIELLEEEIRITRCVQGVLDELHQFAFDESVPEEDRLLLPEPREAIDMARDSLSFG